MDEDEFEDYDREVELALYREYRDVVSQFRYVVETERRFYLANEVELVRQDTEHDFYFELTMNDVWVWDVYRSDRFVKSVRVLTFKDVNVEELGAPDGALPPRSVLPEIVLTGSLDDRVAKLAGQGQPLAQLLGLRAGVTEVLGEQHFVLKAKGRIVIIGLLKGSAVFTCDNDAACAVPSRLDETPPGAEQPIGNVLDLVQEILVIGIGGNM